MTAASHPLYRYLEATYGVDAALPAPRAALGLMATLRMWRKRGHAPAVALCANVCHDVVAALLGAEFRPIFLDIDPATGLVPPAEWSRGREAGASVALVVHLYGNPADVGAARAAFPPDQTLVIDDAAQALGTRVGDQLAGGQGDVGLLSFGPTKHVEGGGGALLFHSPELAMDVTAELATIGAVDAVRRDELVRKFRRGLETARAELRQKGAAAAWSRFSGLLEGYTPALAAAFPMSSSDIVLASLENYEPVRESRIVKAQTWSDELTKAGLQGIGMPARSVPWRYAARLPGIDWRVQHELAEAMRRRGVKVSHWYLPGHWMCGIPAGSLPGVEQLSGEIFQFWVDGATSFETVKEHASIVAEIVEARRY